jgi:hypothetical protein
MAKTPQQTSFSTVRRPGLPGVCWNLPVGIGLRTARAGTTVAAAVALTACAPAQPPPQPGGAELSGDAISYDRPEFLTNRAPVLEAGKECDKMPAVLQKLGAKPQTKPYQNDDIVTHVNYGCRIGFTDADLSVAISSVPFSSYWVGAVPKGQPGDAITRPDGAASSLSRQVMAGKYYAVEFATDDKTASPKCHAAVDTGAAQPLLVTAEPSDVAPEDSDLAGDDKMPVSKIRAKLCPLATKFAARTLEVVDPQGGSRAQ